MEMPVQVTLDDPGLQGSQSIQIQLDMPSGSGGYVPSTRAIFSNGSTVEDLQLSNGVPDEIYVIPTSPSVQVDDIVLQAFVEGGSAPASPPVSTPGAPSGLAPAPPAQPVGTGKMDGIELSMGSGTTAGQQTGVIYGSSTPASMVKSGLYRIPPRRDTGYWVKKNGAMGADKKIYVRVLNNSDNNGRAELWTTDLQCQLFDVIPVTGDDFSNNVYTNWVRGKVDNAGVYQTKPGNAGNLKMAIFNKEAETDPAKAGVITAGFSVAAIPNWVRAEKPEVVAYFSQPGQARGMEMRLWGTKTVLAIASDSGDEKDLDQVKVSEVIPKAANVGTGLFRGQTGEQPIVWLPAIPPANQEITDYNGYHIGPFPAGAVTKAQLVAEVQKRFDDRGNGSLTNDQYFIFADARTGMPTNADGKDAGIVKNSGFRLKIENEKTAGGQYNIYVTRTPNANNGADKGTVADDTKKTSEVKN
jgi:hypothetical protein